MISPRITFLVHGGPDSPEAVRARGLSQQYPLDRIRILLRTGPRSATARRWRSDLRDFPPDLVYVISTALPGSLLALEARWIHSIPYILDTGDAVYEMARRSGVGAGLRLPALWLTERVAQRYASAVVVRGTLHEAYLRRQRIARVAVIRDGYMPGRAPALKELETLRRRLGLDGAFVVGVMGSLVYSPRLGICYGWDLIRALAQIRDRRVRGLIIGDGSGRAWLEAEARAYGVDDRVAFTGRVRYVDVPVYLRLMDVALSTQTNNTPGQVRTTGKLPEYMAAGRFILASRVGEAALVLPDTMLVDYRGEVDPAYPGRLAERITTLVGDPEMLRAASELEPLAERLFSYPVLSAQLNELIARL
jgi:glycosyltransferase involved in cell wall biosynthesis